MRCLEILLEIGVNSDVLARNRGIYWQRSFAILALMAGKNGPICNLLFTVLQQQLGDRYLEKTARPGCATDDHYGKMIGIIADR